MGQVARVLSRAMSGAELELLLYNAYGDNEYM